jgi:hypothetical protein
MQSTVVESTLTDESKVYAVEFIDGSQKVSIACVNIKSAYALQEALAGFASYATIEPFRSDVVNVTGNGIVGPQRGYVRYACSNQLPQSWLPAAIAAGFHNQHD